MGLSKKLFFYYDILSVHSWILFERILDIGPNSKLSITLQPIHSPTVITLIGNKVPYFTAAQKKFYFRDIRFLGRLHNIPIKTPLDEIDDLLLGATSSLLPQYFLTMISLKYPDLLTKCSRLLWNRLWIENRTIHNEEDIHNILTELDLPISCFNVLEDELWSSILNERHNKALESGCFGVPWIVIKNELGSQETYFGCDRWPLIQRHHFNDLFAKKKNLLKFNNNF